CERVAGSRRRAERGPARGEAPEPGWSSLVRSQTLWADHCVPSGLRYTRGIHTCSLDQLEQHLGLDYVVVHEARVSAGGDLAAVGAGALVLFEPAEPVLLLGSVPNFRNVYPLVFRKFADGATEVAWGASR